METGETGIPGLLGQTVQHHVERKKEEGRDNVIILNLPMEEMIVREMTQKMTLRYVIQMLVVQVKVIIFNVQCFAIRHW